MQILLQTYWVKEVNHTDTPSEPKGVEITLWQDIPTPERLGKDIYMLTTLLAERTSRPAAHIRRLLREGKVKGVKVGNMWLSTVPAVKEYEDHAVADRHQR